MRGHERGNAGTKPVGTAGPRREAPAAREGRPIAELREALLGLHDPSGTGSAGRRMKDLAGPREPMLQARGRLSRAATARRVSTTRSGSRVTWAWVNRSGVSPAVA
jgi:hypothetical protein